MQNNSIGSLNCTLSPANGNAEHKSWSCGKHCKSYLPVHASFYTGSSNTGKRSAHCLLYDLFSSLYCTFSFDFDFHKGQGKHNSLYSDIYQFNLLSFLFGNLSYTFCKLLAMVFNFTSLDLRCLWNCFYLPCTYVHFWNSFPSRNESGICRV